MTTSTLPPPGIEESGCGSVVAIPYKRILTPEKLFFDFAFPAYGNCTRQPHDRKAELEELYLAGKAPTMRELSRLFPVGIMSLRKFSGNTYMLLEDITLKNVEDYISHGHNEMLKSGMILTSHSDTRECMVHKATIEDFRRRSKGDVLLVSYEGMADPGDPVRVFGYRVPNPQLREKIQIHRSYAIGRV